MSVNLVSKPLAFASVIADALSSPLPRPVPHRTLASTPLTTADSFNAPEPIVPLQDKLLLWKAEKENRYHVQNLVVHFLVVIDIITNTIRYVGSQSKLDSWSHSRSTGMRTVDAALHSA